MKKNILMLSALFMAFMPKSYAGFTTEKKTQQALEARDKAAIYLKQQEEILAQTETVKKELISQNQGLDNAIAAIKSRMNTSSPTGTAPASGTAQPLTSTR